MEKCAYVHCIVNSKSCVHKLFDTQYSCIFATVLHMNLLKFLVNTLKKTLLFGILQQWYCPFIWSFGGEMLPFVSNGVVLPSRNISPFSSEQVIICCPFPVICCRSVIRVFSRRRELGVNRNGPGLSAEHRCRVEQSKQCCHPDLHNYV